MTIEVWLRMGLTALIVTAVVVLVATIVERFQARRPHQDDERLGIKITAAFTTYAVLIGFATLIAQQSYDDSMDALRTEVSAATSITRLAEALPPQNGQPVVDSLGLYVQADLNAWQTLGSPAATPEGTEHLNEVYQNVLDLPVQSGPMMSNAQAALLDALAELDRARMERQLVGRESPNFIWVMLFAGAIIVLSMATLLQFSSRRLRLITLIGMALLIVLALQTIRILSDPITGPIPIRPDPLAQVLSNSATQ